MGLRSAVDLKVQVAPGTPKNALVYIDEHYIGTLAALEAKGVRLPEGEHRLMVEKTGYFPFDRIVISEVKAIDLKIELLRLPD